MKLIEHFVCVIVSSPCPRRVSFNPPPTEHIMNNKKKEKQTRMILI